MSLRSDATDKKTKSFFLKIGVIFSAAAFTIGIIYIVLFVIQLARSWIDRKIVNGVQNIPPPIEIPAELPSAPAAQAPEPPPAPPAPDAHPGLVSGSFTDLFSGAGYINTDGTTLAQGYFTSAFTFPPKFQWENITVSYEGRELPDRSNIQPSAIPPELRQDEIVSSSASPIGLKQGIGIVVKSGDSYEGYVYLYDGTRFEKVAGPERFSSKYIGVLGMGGAENDLLAVYGGAEGIAYRIRRNQKGESTFDDVSRFFHSRLMDGGFRPVIVEQGNRAWYVLSDTSAKPRLLKLFEDASGEIAGAVDFTRAVGVDELQKLSFVKSNGGALVLAGVTRDGAREWFRFTDLGFDKSTVRRIESSDVYSVPSRPANIYEARISRLDYALDGGSLKLFLSNDGASWQLAGSGELVRFKKPGPVLLWRAELSAAKDEKTSPFLDLISIEYWLKYK